MIRVNRKRIINWFESLRHNDNKYHFYVVTLNEKLTLDGIELYKVMYFGGHEYHAALEKYPSSKICTWSYEAEFDDTKKPVYVYRVPL